MIPFSSRELHVSVVQPVLQLLAAPKRFDAVEKSYQDALEELARGKPDDAITDAAAALENMLRTLGCQGNSLGPLIKSAKTKGVLAHHDGNLVSPLMNWVSADRSETGDAHGKQVASVADAWLIVHVVGALLLRISQSPRLNAK
jgi:hypothetical protein